MSRAHLFATLSGIAALQLALSCGEETAPGNGGLGGTSSAGAGGAAGSSGGAGASGGVPGGGASGSPSSGGSGGTSSGGAASGGEAGGGAAGSPGAEGGGGGLLVDAGDASSDDSGVAAAGDGDPCPNGDECGEGLICVGYGNPLPNGESTACRRSCTQQSPPPDCTCTGAGFCEESDGTGGTGGTGGSPDGGPACGQLIVNAGCADADDGTTDFQSGEFQGCLHWRDLGEGLGWIHYETFGGFHYDLQTSLGWVTRTNGGTMTLAQVEAFCADFSIAGLSDWRVPTIDEARSLAGGCAETAPGGSCQLSDASCLSASCGISEDCTSCSGLQGPYQPGNYYCRTDVELCTGFHTTSLCPDCGTPGDWRYGTINGNFFAGSVDDGQFPTCVMENIPNAVPCRP